MNARSLELWLLPMKLDYCESERWVNSALVIVRHAKSCRQCEAVRAPLLPAEHRQLLMVGAGESPNPLARCLVTDSGVFGSSEGKIGSSAALGTQRPLKCSDGAGELRVLSRSCADH